MISRLGGIAMVAIGLGLHCVPVGGTEGKTVDQVYLRANVRTPDQMAAFYEARGFPVKALEILRSYCFVTIIVRNQSNRVVWLEPLSWEISMANGNKARPMSRDDWERVWDSIALPAAQRSTFKWTQLPKSRDLRPHEPVGGNLAFRRFEGKFSLKMKFETGPERKGTPIRAEIGGLSCTIASPERK